MYPIPIRPADSRAVLPPEAVAALFGAGHRLRGTERVEVVALGKQVTAVEVHPGPTLRLVLDAADRHAAPPDAPLRLVGPKGVLLLDPPAEALPSRLVLPPGLLTAWGLAPGRRVAVAVGRAVLTDVPVEAGEAVALHADRAVLLAGEVTESHAARWLPDFEAPTSSPPSPGAPPSEPATPPRVITENDVRQARKRREKLRVGPGQIVTPAARALGRELGVLDEPGGP